MQKAKTYTSPFGKAIYPHLTKCDVRFKAEGEYKVDLELNDVDANDILKLLKEYATEEVCVISSINCFALFKRNFSVIIAAIVKPLKVSF